MSCVRGLAVQPGLVAIRETSCECRRERAGAESGRECGPARPPQSAVTTDMEINPGRIGMEKRDRECGVRAPGG